MPATIRLQTDRISADLAAHRLEQRGIPVQVVSDDTGFGMGTTGTPMSFSLVVPSERETEARRVLSGAPTDERGPRKHPRSEARERRRR